MVGYRKAWDRAIAEFNNFGLARSHSKVRIDETTSSLMFGFKAELEDKKGLET